MIVIESKGLSFDLAIDEVDSVDQRDRGSCKEEYEKEFIETESAFKERPLPDDGKHIVRRYSFK